MIYRIALPALLLASKAALAEAPKVVADILPVHSLVSTVMQGVGEPTLLLPPGAEPHSYSMRPSEARTLSEADIVFWVGGGLTPWLSKSIETVAEGALAIELMEADGFEPRMIEEGEQEGHDDEEEHANEGSDDKKFGYEDLASEDHGEFDLHAWLDPEAAIVWLAAITEELAARDPDNAAIYEANAETASGRLRKLTNDLAKTLAPLRKVGFVTQHAAYGYFIDRFDLTYEGALSSSEAEDPSPADLARVQAQIAEGHVSCVFGEVQLSDRYVRTAVEGSDTKTGMLDTLGSALQPGPAAYEQLIAGLGDSFLNCLTN